MRKNILLIGGSYGIGFEIALKLLDNHNVYIASRTSENLGNLEVTHIPYDASKDEIDITTLPSKIDGLLYCPGTINLKPFHELTPATFNEDMQSNFMFLVKIIHAILPNLQQSTQASIVLFSIASVKTGLPNHTCIAAAKGAIEGFARALAAEYNPKIRVNVVVPALSSVLINADSSASQITKSEDVTNIANFLLGNDSSGITGQIIGVDAGN